MLRLYPIALDWLKAVRPLIAQIARYDRDLAKQLRRSSSSVILNLGEGMYSRGGHRTNAYGAALREMGESYSALQAAQVNGYVAALEPGRERTAAMGVLVPAWGFRISDGCEHIRGFCSRSSAMREPYRARAPRRASWGGQVLSGRTLCVLCMPRASR